MISTEDRSPSGRDSATARLNNFNNNNNEDVENSRLYYQYVPSSSPPPRDSFLQTHPLTASQSTPIISLNSPPASPLLHHRQDNYSHNHLHHPQPIVLRDPNSSTDLNTSSVVALPSSSPPAAQTSNGIADFIQHTLSSRLIPKLGSIVKRFSLNYSGEGLVTDRQRTRTVRVGIRFQVQVDSFVNNRQQDNRPRAILRTQSAPAVEQLDSGFSSPTAEVFPPNRQLALEYNTNNSTGEHKNISQSQSNSSSTLSVGGGDFCCTTSGGAGSSGIQIGIGSAADSHHSSCSSCESSEASSPTLPRRNNLTLPLNRNHNHQNHSTSNTLAFHNRINQALNSYRNHQQEQQQQQQQKLTSANHQSRARRSSVNVYRRGSASPERSSSISPPATEEHSGSSMEDASSYQVLRHFPGSNVNSLNELSWETAAFEKEIRDRIQWLGDKVSSIRVPRIVSQLVDFGREYARENPVTALILLALCLTSSAPVLIFLVFAVATILVTFLGFLFVEGTVLTAATVIFGGVIILVGFATLTAVLLGMLGYFTTTQAYLVVTGRSQIFRFLRKIPIIGRFFPNPPPVHSTHKDDNNENQENSNLLVNGNVSTGEEKMANGHGPYRSQKVTNSTPYYVDEEDDEDDINDILDSDDEAVEVEQEAEIKRAEEKQNTTATSTPNVVTNCLSTSASSDLEDDEVLEDEDDLGNQEVTFRQENGVLEESNEEADSVSRTSSASPVRGEKAASPVVMMNGHEEKERSPERESENPEESVA